MFFKIIIKQIVIRNKYSVLKLLVLFGVLYNCYMHNWILKEPKLQHSDKRRLHYQQVGKLPLYIFSAIAQFDVQHNTYSKVSLLVWEGTKNKLYNCCFYDADGSFISSLPSTQHFKKDFNTPLFQKVYSCSLPSPFPNRVTLALTNEECVHTGDYTPIFYPGNDSGKFGVCTKAAYATLDPKRMVEFYEYQKYMGVDKVFSLVFDSFDAESRKVIEYYERQGFAELIPFGLPGLPIRGFEHHNRTYPQYTQDEHIVTYHCQAKMQRFSYGAIIDWDEFIVPKQDIKLKDLAKILLKRWENGGIFTLDVGFFILDWGKTTNGNSSLYIGQYTQRTMITEECHKNIHIPSRQVPYSLMSHHFNVYPQYKRYMVPHDIAILNHYRKCAEKWNDCLTKERFTDSNILKYQKRIEGRVKEILNDIMKN